MIRKVTFRFASNYDPARIRLVVDAITAAGQPKPAWENTQFGATQGDSSAVIDYSLSNAGFDIIFDQTVAQPVGSGSQGTAYIYFSVDQDTAYGRVVVTIVAVVVKAQDRAILQPHPRGALDLDRHGLERIGDVADLELLAVERPLLNREPISAYGV